MDKTTTENKLARNVESKRTITAANCPAKGEHRSYLGRVHEPCGERIPIATVYEPAEYVRLFEVGRSATTESGTSAEVAALWSEYADVEAERARLAGEIAKADRELLDLRQRGDDARYKGGNARLDDDAPVLATAEAVRARRDELVEARDAAVDRSQKLLLQRSKVEAREAAERRRVMHDTSERPGLVERVTRALR